MTVLTKGAPVENRTDLTGASVTRVANVGIPVNDHDRAIAFYVDHLGFEVRRDATFGGGMRWVEVAPPGAATTIALAPTPSGKSTGVDTGVRLSVADAGAAHAALRAAGVDVDSEVMRWVAVPPMFSFRDPDGNTLYVVEETEG
jgi:catechol 2,3-dioxygenase-like lactoylglutathione lyase family enzyme